MYDSYSTVLRSSGNAWLQSKPNPKRRPDPYTCAEHQGVGPCTGRLGRIRIFLSRNGRQFSSGKLRVLVMTFCDVVTRAGARTFFYAGISIQVSHKQLKPPLPRIPHPHPIHIPSPTPSPNPPHPHPHQLHPNFTDTPIGFCGLICSSRIVDHESHHSLVRYCTSRCRNSAGVRRTVLTGAIHRRGH